MTDEGRAVPLPTFAAPPKIEKGIPIPQGIATRSAPRKKYPFREMEVGDSFFAATPKKTGEEGALDEAATFAEEERLRKALVASLQPIKKKLGRKYLVCSTKQLRDFGSIPKDATDYGVRVWRTE